MRFKGKFFLRPMIFIGAVFFLSLGSATLRAQDFSIGNEFLTARIEIKKNAFSLRTPKAREDFVSKARFTNKILSVKKIVASDPVWGKGEELRVQLENGWESTLRLFPGSRFLQVHTTVHNKSKKPYVVASHELLRFEANLGLPTEKINSFGSGFLHPVNEAPGSFSFTALVDPETRKGVVAACLTHERGSGVFFTEIRDGRPEVNCRVDYGRYQVNPGKSRKTETLLIGCFDDARLGLEAYADAVVRQYAINLKPQPSVYCTWYHGGASNEEKLAANGAFAAKHLKPFGFSVVQIDDKWQAKNAKGQVFKESEMNFKGVGPVKVFSETNDNYPKGMEYTARNLRKMGLVPGIWFMPFAGTWNNPYFADKQDLFAHWPDGSPVVTRWSGTLLDMSNPKTEAFVRERVKRIADWGYGYFKLDGMHTGAVSHNVYVNTGYSTSGKWLNTQNFVGDQEAGPGAKDVSSPSTVLLDPNTTHIEAYRKGLEVVREEAPDVFVLGCNISQNMKSMGAAFGLIDAMRIGPDNGGAGVGKMSAVMVGPSHGSNLYFLNRRVWYNDPDPIYVRTTNPLNKARLMASWVAVSGSMLTTSYQFADLPAERLDILKRVMPGHQAVARPVDLFESPTARIWLLTDTSRKVRRDVIGLFNWNEKESDSIVYDMAKIGLDPNVSYTAFDFWGNRFTGPIRGTLRETLKPASCRILALRPVADHPQLIATSRHITQGVIDVLEENWDAGEKVLSGRSLLVGGDPYEMRIALPAGGLWKAERITAKGADTKLVSQSEQGARALIETSENQEVQWRVKFSKTLK